jgi:hypothetical protein
LSAKPSSDMAVCEIDKIECISSFVSFANSANSLTVGSLPVCVIN